MKHRILIIEEISLRPDNGNGVRYYIRTSTQQINSSIAGNFILQATFDYSAIVLMVICLIILSLQQLLDAAHYKYRFGVLHKLGIDWHEAEHLILKQLAVWLCMLVGMLTVSLKIIQ